MSWKHLPPELVHQILSDSSLCKADIVRVAHVNRHFNTVVLRILYREVSFRDPQAHTSLEQFNYSITKHPELAALTRYLDIGKHGIDKSKVIEDLLGKLHSLEHIRLSFNFQMNFEDIPGKSPLLKLQRAVICNRHLTFGDIAFILQLPRIATLDVGNRLGNKSSHIKPFPPTIRQHAPLTKLAVGGATNWSSELAILLTYCPTLTNLVYHIFDQVDEEDPPVSLAGLSRALRHCQKILTTLRLDSYFYGVFDKTQIDISFMETLRILLVNSHFLFNADARHNLAGRNGLYARLPSSLEELKISFPRDSYAFVNVGSHNTGAPLCETQNLSWLKELADNKQTHLSRLSCVRIFERIMPPNPIEMQSTLHDTPATIKHAFHAADIDIKLYLRSYC